MRMDFVGIPINELMCTSSPSAHLLTADGALKEYEIGGFIDMLQSTISVWAEFLTRIADCPVGWADSRLEFVDMMGETLLDAYQDDDPITAWPTRQRLSTMVDQFDAMADEMARPFTGPHTIRHFYHNLASRVRATFELIMRGDEI